ncbi:unnamed protein product [Somion occarium]|uniref:DUF6535 domain-containing protein n=1 Tax=Somion occarium TaxID=3059160 RepID=A0ABP1D600_9APHY
MSVKAEVVANEARDAAPREVIEGSGSHPQAAPMRPKHNPTGLSPDQVLQSDRFRTGAQDGWSKISKLLQQHDERKIQNCKEDIDTLLVFAGLFSAVLTAFVTESYTTLQDDPAEASTRILLHISHQIGNFMLTASSVNSTAPSITMLPFKATSSALWINGFWFSSLTCSLVTASLGILVKQWLREYMTHDSLSPRAQFRVRNFRYTGLLQGRVFELAALLPMLLQCALLLFFIGLSEFLRNIAPAIGWVVTALIACWLSFFIATTVAPMCWSQCPYRTPLFTGILQSARSTLYIVWNWLRLWGFTVRRRLGTVAFMLPRMPDVALLPTLAARHFRVLLSSITGAFEWWYFYYVEQNIATVKPTEESQIRADSYHDIDFLVAADDMFQDDELLQPLGECLLDVDFPEALHCIRKIIKHRRNVPAEPTILKSFVWISPSATRLRTMVVNVLNHQVDMMLAHGDGQIIRWSKQMHEGLMFVLTCPGPHPENEVRAFIHRMVSLGKVSAGAVLIALCSCYRYPVFEFGFQHPNTTYIEHVLSAGRELIGYTASGAPKSTHYGDTVLLGPADTVRLCHHLLCFVVHCPPVALDDHCGIFMQVQSDIESALRAYFSCEGPFIDAIEIVSSAKLCLVDLRVRVPHLVRQSLLEVLSLFLPEDMRGTPGDGTNARGNIVIKAGENPVSAGELRLPQIQ